MPPPRPPPEGEGWGGGTLSGVNSLRASLPDSGHQTRLGLLLLYGSFALETVNIYDAKTRLSQLVDKAAAGEDVVVSRNGKPLVRITRLEGPKQRIKFGVLKGRLKVPADFDAPLPDDVLGSFEGR